MLYVLMNNKDLFDLIWITLWANNKHVVCSVLWEDQNLGHVYYVSRHRLFRVFPESGKTAV